LGPDLFWICIVEPEQNAVIIYFAALHFRIEVCNQVTRLNLQTMTPIDRLIKDLPRYDVTIVVERNELFGSKDAMDLLVIFEREGTHTNVGMTGQ
jgi:hypothetical protein